MGMEGRSKGKKEERGISISFRLNGSWETHPLLRAVGSGTWAFQALMSKKVQESQESS